VVTRRAKDLTGAHAFADVSVSPPLDRAHDPIGPGGISPYLQHLGTAYRIGATSGYEFDLADTPVELTPGVEYVRLVLGEFDASAHWVSSRRSEPYLPRREQPSEGGDFDDPNAHQDRLQLGLELSWRRNLSSISSLLARTYADVVDQSARWDNHPYFSCGSTLYGACAKTNAGYAKWIGTEIQANFDWNGEGSLTTMLGTDGRIRRVGYQNGIDQLATGERTIYGKVDPLRATSQARAPGTPARRPGSRL
jgi:hypothetical protein